MASTAAESSRTLVIVNADDYGYTPGVSEGIRQAFLAGTVSSATAMMNTPTIAEAMAAARRETPELPFGVHLVLTYGRPLSPPREVASLVDETGAFNRLAVLRADPAVVDPGEVAAEWSRQIDRLAGFGVHVDHLDSHHHAGYLHPRLTQVMIDLASRAGVAIRKPPPEAHPQVAALFGPGGTGQRVWTPDVFVGDLMAGSSAEKFRRLVEELPPGVVAELMVHPGIVDAELCATSTYATPRAAELATLLDGEVVAMIRRARPELVTFARARADHAAPG